MQVGEGRWEGGKQKAYQVTVAGQAPLSIHCERDEGEDRVQGMREGQEEQGGCRVGDGGKTVDPYIIKDMKKDK